MHRAIDMKDVTYGRHKENYLCYVADVVTFWHCSVRSRNLLHDVTRWLGLPFLPRRLALACFCFSCAFCDPNHPLLDSLLTILKHLLVLFLLR